MQQIRLFKGLESELKGLEGEINAWLQSSGVRVLSMTSNIAPQTTRGERPGAQGFSAFAPSDILVAILYEDSGAAGGR